MSNENYSQQFNFFEDVEDKRKAVIADMGAMLNELSENKDTIAISVSVIVSTKDNEIHVGKGQWVEHSGVGCTERTVAKVIPATHGHTSLYVYDRLVDQAWIGADLYAELLNPMNE